MKPVVRKVLSHIAARRLNIPTLETRGSDSLDFYDGIAVWSIHDALCQAYSAGKLAAHTAEIRPYTNAITQRIDDLIAAIKGNTDQFDPEIARLQAAVTKVEQFLEGGAA